MRNRILSFLVCAVVGNLDGLAGVQAAERSEPPVSAKVVSKKEGKPPMKFINAFLELTNRTQAPLWFVLPTLCDQPPVLRRHLRIEKGFKPEWIVAQGFNTGKYHKVTEGSQGKAYQLQIFGVENDKNFWLFRLPPGGKIAFESYQFAMFSEYRRSCRVWTADAITVNGKMPLEKWLPFETLSDRVVLVRAGTLSDNLNFDTRTYRVRTDFRQEPITELDLNITGTWEFQFAGFNGP